MLTYPYNEMLFYKVGQCQHIINQRSSSPFRFKLLNNFT